MHRKIFPILMLALFLAPAWKANAAISLEQPALKPLPASSPAEVIAGINNYRASLGLPAYSTNSTLMQLAQAQSDWQASISDVTHTGPGGTRPRDRAYAVGYGGGNTIWVSEIIYGGYEATAANAIGWWKTSQIHNDTMLASTYQEIGAGVAVSSDGFVYFTAVCAYVVGGNPDSGDGEADIINDDEDAQAAGTAEVAAAVPTVQAILIIPVQAQEPAEDGSIAHIVRSGQALWNISAVYDVPIEDLLEFNGLQEWSPIFPGDTILVRPAYTPTPSPTPTVPTPTPKPTKTPTKRITVAAAVSTRISQATPNAASEADTLQTESGAVSPAFKNPNVRWIVILTLVALVAVMVASMFMQNRSTTASPAKTEDTSNADPVTANPLDNDEDIVV
ncbi:MAG: LysM peptidoglycan-binding domain-containing protein [Anaerolineales bacterium]|nr:LysM peptidoglycan-binding domain-containing protein [Anaerolineales bacterium]